MRAGAAVAQRRGREAIAGQGGARSRVLPAVALAIGLGLGCAAGSPPAPLAPSHSAPAPSSSTAAGPTSLSGSPANPAREPAAAAGGSLPAPAPASALPEAELEDLLAEEEPEVEVSDPLEPANRAFFRLNRVLDRFFFDPVTRAYRWAVPEPGRRGVRHFFANLNNPVVLVNDVLQLRPRRAGATAARFVINTTVGIAGLFDVAKRFGLEPHHADFGQTLNRVGIGAGPFLMLPVMGPTTARDAVGNMIDTLLRPDTWILSPGGRLVLASGGGLSRREAHREELKELERSSLDLYVTLRNAYLMNRAAELEEASVSSRRGREPAPAR